MATVQPQEGRSATDGPDIARVREAAFVCETCLSLLEMEAASSALPIDLINRNNFRLIVDGSSQLMHHANPVRVVIRTPPLQDIAASQLFEDVLR